LARITLNHSVGGLNPVAVELAGRSAVQDRVVPDRRRRERNRWAFTSTEKLPFWAKIQRELEAEGISPPKLRSSTAQAT